MSHLELLESELQSFQIPLPQEQKSALAAYCDELERWNKKINLTSLSGASLVRRLVVEPVWIAGQLPFAGALIDIGSGNGSPAVPFQIVRPVRACLLVEARARRAAFLRHLKVRLRLADLTVYRARLEDLAPRLGRADWITLQAVSLNERLLEAVRLIAGPETTIVWITSSEAETVLAPFRILTVPRTGRQVFLYRLDLS